MYEPSALRSDGHWPKSLPKDSREGAHGFPADVSCVQSCKSSTMALVLVATSSSNCLRWKAHFDRSDVSDDGLGSLGIGNTCPNSVHCRWRNPRVGSSTLRDVRHNIVIYCFSYHSVAVPLRESGQEFANGLRVHSVREHCGIRIRRLQLGSCCPSVCSQLLRSMHSCLGTFVACRERFQTGKDLAHIFHIYGDTTA